MSSRSSSSAAATARSDESELDTVEGARQANRRIRRGCSTQLSRAESKRFKSEIILRQGAAIHRGLLLLVGLCPALLLLSCYNLLRRICGGTICLKRLPGSRIGGSRVRQTRRRNIFRANSLLSGCHCVRDRVARM